MKLKGSKCHFAKKEVTFLGHILSGEGIIPEAGKVEAIEKMPSTRSVRDIHAFIGMVWIL